jgi:dihydrofolate reductase
VIIVVAYDKNRLIGADGTIPWHEPDDLIHFRDLTHKSTIIMGRNTWESLPRKPLKHRRNIILSTTIFFSNHPDIKIVESLDEVRKCYQEPIYVIGGETVYKQVLDANYVSKIIATELKYEIDISGKNALCYFPDFKYSGRRIIKEFKTFDVVEYEL